MSMFAKNSSTNEKEAPSAEGAPIRARWALNDLATSDGHRLSAVFSCSLRILSEPAEQKVFLETFLTEHSAIKPQDIIAHFQPSLHSVATALAQKDQAISALDPATHPRWIQALRSAADATAFSCGIALLPPFTFELTSPSLDLERRQEMQRTAALRTASQRAEHFQRAAELLGQWESLKSATPSLLPGQLLEQLSEADRPAMLETLLMGSAPKAKQPDLWAVAGASLVRVRLDSDSIEPQLLSLPTTAGPLRSIQWKDDRLLIGARKGVIFHEAKTLETPAVYLYPDLSSDHGFTSVAFSNDGIWACHRDVGVVFWTYGYIDRPSFTLAAAQLNGTAKHGVWLAGSSGFLFAVGSSLLSVRASESPTTVANFASPIVSILKEDDRTIAVTEDGTISIFDVHSLEKISALRPVNQATAAALLPWLGTSRILLTTDQGPIHCIGLDDQVITHYSGPHLGMRTVAGSPGKIAAMSADRQRVIFWNTWDGRQPASEIHLTSLTRHRIADITFG